MVSFFPVFGIDGPADLAVAVCIAIRPRAEEIWHTDKLASVEFTCLPEQSRIDDEITGVQ